MTRFVRAVLAALFATMSGLVLCLAFGGPASADTGGGILINLPASGAGFTTNPTGHLLTVSRMIPGDSANGIMGVRNESGGAADLTISMVDVKSDENGCVHPERAEPGGCAPGPGQLGAALTFGLAVATSEDGTYTPSWTGTAAQLQDGVDLSDGIASGDAVWVRMTLTLPWATGNEVQSDTFGFGVRVTLEGSTGPAATSGVAGISAVRGGSNALGPDSASGLALTGVAIALIGGAGLLLIVSGTLLVLGVRSARRA